MLGGQFPVIPSECKYLFHFTQGWLVKIYELLGLHGTQLWRARPVFISVAWLLDLKVQLCP